MPQAEPERGLHALPDEFFDEILPAVTDLAELKVVLYIARLSARSGHPAVGVSQLMSPEIIRAVAPAMSPRPAELRLQQSLERAVANGYLYRLSVSRERERVTYLVLATEANRDFVRRVEGGESRALGLLHVDGRDTVDVYRPNIFSFYEQHIGPLTPLIAEQLRDAERSYPRTWVEEAIRRALAYNKR